MDVMRRVAMILAMVAAMTVAAGEAPAAVGGSDAVGAEARPAAVGGPAATGAEDEGDREALERELAELKRRMEGHAASERELRASLEQALRERRELEERLEARLERIYIETVDNSPYATGETLDWGSGPFFGMNLYAPNLYEFEVGYKFNLRKQSLPWQRSYVGKRREMKWGVALGVMHYYDEPVYDPDPATLHESSAFGPYMKLVYGSPVLLNFISTTSHLKVMYLSRLDIAGEGFADHDWGMGIGGNLNFWLYENMCLNLGLSTEGTFKGLSDEDEEGDRHLLSWKIRPMGGITIFF